MNLLKKIDEKFEEFILGGLLIGISSVILLQIVLRLMKMSLPWPEELARYFYIWSVFLSLSYLIRSRTNLRVDLILNFVPDSLKRVLEVFIQLVNAMFFGTLFYHSFRVITAVKMSSQTSPALEIPMYIVYLVIPAGFFLSTFRALQQIYFIMKGDTHKPVEVTSEI